MKIKAELIHVDDNEPINVFSVYSLEGLIILAQYYEIFPLQTGEASR